MLRCSNHQSCHERGKIRWVSRFVWGAGGGGGGRTSGGEGRVDSCENGNKSQIPSTNIANMILFSGLTNDLIKLRPS